MKKIFQLAVILMAFVPAVCFGQTDKKVWAELKAFHTLMSSSFHPAEEGNYAPLRSNAEGLFRAAKKLRESPVPNSYKVAETKDAIRKLLIECGALHKAVVANKTDADIKILITEAHNTLHKIEGECRNEE